MPRLPPMSVSHVSRAAIAFPPQVASIVKLVGITIVRRRSKPGRYQQLITTAQSDRSRIFREISQKKMIPGTTRNCILLHLSQQGNPAQYAALPLFWMLTDTNPINSRFARKGKYRLSLLPTHQAEPRTTQEKVYRRSIHPSGMLVSTYNKKKKQKTCHILPCRKHVWKHISTQNTNYQRHQQSKERMPLPAVDYQSRRRITDSLMHGWPLSGREPRKRHCLPPVHLLQPLPDANRFPSLRHRPLLSRPANR